MARHGLRRGEFVALMSLITATIAISVDTVLPAFDEIEADYQLTDDGLAVSLSLTVFFAALGLGTLIWGPFADRYGRKPVMFVGLLATALGALVSSVAPTFEVFLVGRVLWGIAAAGPRTVALAITRDSYDGDDMARIMSLQLALFLIVPILAPGLGELLLFLGSWRLTTLAACILAVIAALWFSRINETLDSADVLPLEFGRVTSAAKAVATNRTTVLFTVGTMMLYASFFPWLGSSPTIINDIYNRDSQFALIFAANAALMGVAVIAVERLVRRYSTLPVVIGQTVMLLITSAAYVLVSMIDGGVPSFWVWFVLVSILTALNSGSSSLLQTLAMQPMGAIAGTAASVIGAIVFLGGAVLGSIVDRFVDDTVTPIGMGFLIYGLVIAACLWAAEPDVLEDAEL